MDLRRIIHELEIEKQRLDEAIMALERLSNGNSHRRNREFRRPALRPQSDHEHLVMAETPSSGFPAHPVGK